MTGREIQLVRRIKARLERRGAVVIKTHGGQLRQGEADLIACYPVQDIGVFVAIEVKIPGNKPTELQASRLRRWSKAGAIAFYTDNPDEVVDFIESELARRGIDHE